jgi:Arc/MetJ-type ribon-helix-helix transcriptional regulator
MAPCGRGPVVPRGACRIANWYAVCMAQFVTRLDDRLVEQVDALVSDGVVANRSEAVRLGLHRLVDQHQRYQIGARIAEGYRRQPQTDEELAGLDQATSALVAEQPW